MAISFVNSAEVNKATTSTSSFTGSYTVGSGTDRLLVVGIIFVDTGIDVTVTGMTYGGVAMTFINRVNNGGGNRGVELWYLLNPATGSNTLSGTFSGASSNGYSAIALDYSGVNQSSQPDASATNTTTGLSLTTSVITTSNSCWLIGIGGNNASTAGSNTVLRTRSTQANSTGFVTMDTGTFQNPAGYHSMTINISSAFSDCMAIASFSPSSPSYDITYGEYLGDGTIKTELQKTDLINDSSLTSYWRMEGNSNDSKGINHGTDTDITYSSGRFGQCSSFNGSSSKIVITDTSSLKPTGNFTISGWIKTGVSDNRIFSTWSQNTNTAGILFLMNGDKISLISARNTGTTDNVDYRQVTGATSITNNNWTHVVGTYDGTNLKVYVNGILDGTTPWANNPAYQSTNYVRIGCQNNTGTDLIFFNGKIDDLALFNGKALSDLEVKSIYRIGSTKLLLHLNGNSTDSSGNGNNGTDTNISYVDGKFGKCASMTGNGRIITTSNIGISGQGARTMTGWFNCQTQPSVSEIQSFFGYGALSTNNWFMVGYDGSNSKKGKLSIYGTDLTTSSVLTPLGSAGWHQICVTYSGGAFSSSTLKFYIDGKDYPFASYAGTPNTTDSVLTIGDYSNATSYPWKGYVDEFITENRAWSAQEVAKRYAYSKGYYATLNN